MMTIQENIQMKLENLTKGLYYDAMITEWDGATAMVRIRKSVEGIELYYNRGVKMNMYISTVGELCTEEIPNIEKEVINEHYLWRALDDIYIYGLARM